MKHKLEKNWPQKVPTFTRPNSKLYQLQLKIFKQVQKRKNILKKKQTLSNPKLSAKL